MRPAGTVVGVSEEPGGTRRAASAIRARARLIVGSWPVAICELWLVLIVVGSILAPWVAPYDPVKVANAGLTPPSAAHLFGTDVFGRDVFSRILWGGRITLVTAAGGVILSAVIGVPMGMAAGYGPRWLANLIMRAVDVLLAFPGILLALVVIAIGGSGVVQVMIAVGVSGVPAFSRVLYGSTMAAKERDYVVAARVVGSGPLRILGYHIFPNVVTSFVVLMSSSVGWAILLEAGLNFLGFGVHLPTAEWGSDLAAGQQWVAQAWWVAAFPGAAISATILAANFVGDHVAHVLERRTTRGMGDGGWVVGDETTEQTLTAGLHGEMRAASRPDGVDVGEA